ncbi:MAG: stage III sporulation protein AF [Clostridia bacterium]|nr:stage III sporulation protein AF [Clostridia bacterium]
MSSWVLSIVGVVCLGVLLDLIVPEGQTNKYIKGVFALLVIFVIISPLPKLVGKNIDFSFTQSSYETDKDYLLAVEEMKIENKENTLENLLLTSGYEAEVTILTSSTNQDSQNNSEIISMSKIDNVQIVLSQEVLNEADMNIFIASIKTLASRLFEIEEDAVDVVWG